MNDILIVHLATKNKTFLISLIIRSYNFININKQEQRLDFLNTTHCVIPFFLIPISSQIIISISKQKKKDMKIKY